MAQLDLTESTVISQGLAADIAAEVRRGAETPDHFSTLTGEKLGEILRDSPTLELDSLLNHGGVRIDLDHERIFRDSFWKGSFAKNSLLGWEERLRNTLFGNDKNDKNAKNDDLAAASFTGGSFWKRFDRIVDGTAFGYVVNYQLTALPGLPEVRREVYPDDKRSYFRKGDPLLLLRYTNAPYKLVYDTIKIIDAQNAIGVMHFGEFPNGIEIAKFVMARHNYPFDNLSVEDHAFLFQNAEPVSPSSPILAGKWQGRVAFLDTPDTSLANQHNPILMETEFLRKDGATFARWTAGVAQHFEKQCLAGELRMVKPGLLLGLWRLPGGATDLEKLKSAVGPAADVRVLRFLLRKKT